MDIDGNYSYSKVVIANFTGAETNLRIYPVPAIGEVKIFVPSSAKDQILTILDNSGSIRERIKVAKKYIINSSAH